MSDLCSPESLIALPTSPVEKAKRLAARQAVDENVKTGMRLGVGSGSTIVYAVQRLGERVRDEGLVVTCVPTSFQSTQLICRLGLPLSDLSRTPVLDLAIDGADQVDTALNCIKGGGACQTQEKIIAQAAHRFILIADFLKIASNLGAGGARIPIEVIPSAYVPIMGRLRERFACVPTLRMAVAKAGPVVTDNGCFIIDAVPTTPLASSGGEVQLLHDRIKAMAGVVETGLFPGMAEKAYFGMEDGTVTIKERSSTS